MSSSESCVLDVPPGEAYYAYGAPAMMHSELVREGAQEGCYGYGVMRVVDNDGLLHGLEFGSSEGGFVVVQIFNLGIRCPDAKSRLLTARNYSFRMTLENYVRHEVAFVRRVVYDSGHGDSGQWTACRNSSGSVEVRTRGGATSRVECRGQFVASSIEIMPLRGISSEGLTYDSSTASGSECDSEFGAQPMLVESQQANPWIPVRPPSTEVCSCCVTEHMLDEVGSVELDEVGSVGVLCCEACAKIFCIKHAGEFTEGPQWCYVCVYCTNAFTSARATRSEQRLELLNKVQKEHEHAASKRLKSGSR